MIIVRIWEGLGNQLFQYAYARSLSLRTGYEIYLDTSHCARGSFDFEKNDGLYRKYTLDKFDIKLPTIDYPDYRQMKVISDNGSETLFREDIYSICDDVYINAHCINKFYYKEYKNIIRQDLQLLRKPIFSDKIMNCLIGNNSVSIHIRLTDYLERPFHICNSSYYKNSIEYFTDLYPEVCFLIFSDDMKTAKEMYDIPENAIWVGEENLTDYEELWLMSKCKHHIMAASTFSYWGTWLSDYQSGIVIGPKTWMVNGLYEKEWRIL